jgi:hypothetical protein
MDIFPKTYLAYVCGSVALKWASVYANNFYGANYLPSDASLKKDVIPAAWSGLGDIEALKAVDFTWKADNKPDTGLISQHARDINPAYWCESDGLAHVAQYPIIVYLIQVVNELSAKVRALESRVAGKRYRPAVKKISPGCKKSIGQGERLPRNPSISFMKGILNAPKCKVRKT